MNIPLFIELAPVVMMAVEVIKRFIPDKIRTWANPLIAVITGLGLSYVTGGDAALVDTALQGFGAAATAVAAYKVPKMAGEALKIQ